jgi:hypothetical protein
VKPTTHATFGTYFSVVQEMLMYGNMGQPEKVFFLDKEGLAPAPSARKGRLTFKEKRQKICHFY